MSSLVIIHFHPVEQYPPVLNFMDYILKYHSGNGVWVFTCGSNRMNWRKNQDPKIRLRIFRFVNLSRGSFRLLRYLNYIIFYLFSLVLLLFKRPKSILAYDAVSVMPVYFYKKWLNRKCRILVHFHEYVSPDEMKSSSFFFRMLFRLEKSLIPLCHCISHTNEMRMKEYLEINHPNKPALVRIFPNYPPREWRISGLKRYFDQPLRIVYTGSLSLHTMYLKEFTSWVMANEGNVVWDIFSPYPDRQAVDYIEDLNPSNINFKEPVEYYKLPGLLRNYHVGVILYKGHIPNFVYNAPNKLFEYHVNGLDVWFPDVLKGSLDYCTSASFPRIVQLDFNDLFKIDFKSLVDRSGLNENVGSYSCEDVFPGLLSEIKFD